MKDKKSPRAEAEKELIDSLNHPVSPFLIDLTNFLKRRTRNYVFGPEFDAQREKALDEIDRLIELSGLSPGEFHPSLKVKITLVLSPTDKAPVGTKAIEIPVIEETQD